MFLLHMSFEGEIILPSPSWVSYKPQSLIADNKYHWISTTSDNNWYPTAEILEELVSKDCLLYTSPSPRDEALSRMPSSA